MTTDMDDAEIKHQVVEKLAAKNPEIDRGTIENVVNDEFAALVDRPIRDFFSVLTERAAKKRLKKSV